MFNVTMLYYLIHLVCSKFFVLVVEYFYARFGRRYIVLTCEVLSFACNMACAAAPNIWFFLIMRFLLANAVAGKNTTFIIFGKSNFYKK